MLSRVFVCCLAVVMLGMVGVVPSVFAEEKTVDLKWNLQAGQRIPYKITCSAFGTVTPAIQGIDDLKFETEMYFEFVVLKQLPNGRFECELDASRLKGFLRTDKGMIEVKADRKSVEAKISGRVLKDFPNPIQTAKKFTIGPRGLIVWSPEAAVLKPYFPDMDQRFLWPFFVMPDNPVASGSSVKNQIDIPLPAKGKLTAEVEYKYKSAAPVKGTPAMSISGKGEASLKNSAPPDKNAKATIKSASVTCKGDSVFAGQLVKLSAEQNVTFSVLESNKIHNGRINMKIKIDRQ